MTCGMLWLSAGPRYEDIGCLYCYEPVRLVLLEDIFYGSEEGMA